MGVEKDNREETELSYMFHGFMKSVIKYSVLNALRSYLYRYRKEWLIMDKFTLEIQEDMIVSNEEKIPVDLEIAVFYVDSEKLAEALKKLSKQQKYVIGYMYVWDLTTDEIAMNMGISSHGVYTHKGRALKKLKKQIVGETMHGGSG